MVIVEKPKYKITVGKKAHYLPPREWDIFIALYDAQGVVISRENLAHDKAHDLRIIDQHISRIRRKIGREHIRTVSTRGYAFAE